MPRPANSNYPHHNKKKVVVLVLVALIMLLLAVLWVVALNASTAPRIG
jgi:hypothetical protein